MAWLWSKLTVRRQIKGAEATGRGARLPAGHLRAAASSALARGDRGARGPGADRPARPRASAGGTAGFAVTPGARGLVPPRPRPARVRRRRRGRALRRGARHRAQPGLRAAARRPGSRAVAPATSSGCARSSTTPRCAWCWSSTAASRPSTGPTSPTPSMPFVGLIEQSEPRRPERYGGRRFLYVANYIAPGRPAAATSTPTSCSTRYEPGLRRVNPDFDRSWIRQRWLFREPDAQPIVTAGLPRADAAAPDRGAGPAAGQHHAGLSRGPRAPTTRSGWAARPPRR